MHYQLADLYESVADALPADREALVVHGPAGVERLTYLELDRRANRLAHHLAAAGLVPGDHIGVQLHNGSEYVVTMLACFKVRLVPVNVNYRYVADELRYLFTDARLAGLVVGADLATRAAAVLPDVPSLRHVVSVGAQSDLPDAVDYATALAAQPDTRGFGERSQDDLYIIYTGGTTGMPKGVMWRQEDIFFAGMGGANPVGEPVSSPEQVAQQVVEKYPLTMFPVAPLMHGAAQLATWIGFWQGARIVLLTKFSGEAVVRTIAAEKVNTLSIVGDAMARPMVEAMTGAAADADLSSLLALSSAGAILSQTVRTQLTQRLPNLGILDNFGASETGFQGNAAPGSSPDAGLRFQMNARTTVLTDDLEEVQPGSGVVGRVAQRGHVPLGYYGDAEKTAAAFVEIGGVRHVLLGDLARVEADGTVSVLGRASVCINTGGEKVFPEEVEAALKAHPAVYDVVVTGVPDEAYGSRVAAVVQFRDGHVTDLEELARHCRERVAGYKVPRLLVVVDTVQRSPSGKPDYPWAARVAAAHLEGAATPA